jgi:hypothetical protein
VADGARAADGLADGIFFTGATTAVGRACGHCSSSIQARKVTV